jgi:hypothetical protein
MVRELLDAKSSISTMRLMSLVSLFCGCGLGAYGIYVGRDLIGLSALCGVFVTAAFGGKMVQKITENKSSDS